MSLRRIAAKVLRVATGFEKATEEDVEWAENLGLEVYTLPYLSEPEVRSRNIFGKHGSMHVWRDPSGSVLKKAPVVLVRASQLVPSQHGIPLKGLRRYVDGGTPIDSGIPHVTLSEATGDVHVGHGHTRIASAAIRGEDREAKFVVRQGSGKYRNPTQQEIEQLDADRQAAPHF